MLKIFTTDEGGAKAGDKLTAQYNDWVATFQPNGIEVLEFHTNSNKFGWMLVVKYKILR